MTFFEFLNNQNHCRNYDKWSQVSNSLGKDLDRFFEGFFESPEEGNSGDFKPRIDVQENDKSYHVLAELPGVDGKDLEITYKNKSLTIRGEKKVQGDENQTSKLKSERHYGTFQRTLKLESEVNEDGIQADFKNGVLKIELPKLIPNPENQKKIKIKVS